MRAEELLEAIGEIDEADVLAARRKNIKPWQAVASSLAACLVLAFFLPGILMNLTGVGGDAGNMDEAPPPGAAAPDCMGEIVSVSIFTASGESTLASEEAVAALHALLVSVTDRTTGTPFDALPEVVGAGEYRLLLHNSAGKTYTYYWLESTLISVEEQMEYPILPEDKATLESLLALLE